jgi:hypothetical protein
MKREVQPPAIPDVPQEEAELAVGIERLEPHAHVGLLQLIPGEHRDTFDGVVLQRPPDEGVPEGAGAAGHEDVHHVPAVPSGGAGGRASRTASAAASIAPWCST